MRSFSLKIRWLSMPHKFLLISDSSVKSQEEVRVESFDFCKSEVDLPVVDMRIKSIALCVEED